MTDVQEQISGIRELVLHRAAPGEDSRVVVFRGITEAVARDGGILRARGMDAKNFDKNPVFKWNHGDEVIGRIVKREYDKEAKAWDFHVEFAAPEVSEFADSRFRLVQAGFIRAVSVGFGVREFEEVSDKNREELGLGRFGWVARKWELHELSLVPVGADPTALKRSIEAGEIRAEDIDMEPEKRDIETVTDPVQIAEQMREPETVEDRTVIQTVIRDVEDDKLRAALEENTREQQRTQAAIAELADEVGGLKRFLAAQDEQPVEQVTESESAPESADDSAAVDTSNDAEELRAAFDRVLARVAKKEGEHDGQGNHREA